MSPVCGIFHNKITGEGRVLRGDQLALLHIFFIKNVQVKDVLFNKTDWLCSPGTSFAPLGESHGKGTNHRHTDTHTDIATL